MAMVKPIALNVNAFDANYDNEFSFIVEGGDQVVKNKITIRLQSDNSVVYTNTKETFQLKQTVPAGTLTNGVYYNVYFNTYNANNDESENSNVVPFYCYTTPSLEFSNIPTGDIINSATYDFQVDYSQLEGELLSNVVINLYDSGNVLVKSSGNLYPNEENEYHFVFTEFINDSNYIIKATATTVNGTIVNAEDVILSIHYVNPILYSNLLVTNNCTKGYNELSSNVVICDGETNQDPIKYLHIIDPVSGNQLDYIDLANPQTVLAQNPSVNYVYGKWETKTDKVWWKQGYGVPTDFVFTTRLNPVRLDNALIVLSNKDLFTDGYNDSFVYTIKLKREIPYGESLVKDFLELEGIYTSALGIKQQKVYQISNYVDPLNHLSDIVICFKKVGNTYTLTLDVQKRTANVFKWGESNVKFNAFTDLEWEDIPNTRGINHVLVAEDVSEYFELGFTMLTEGIYDFVDITKDTTKPIQTECPSWDFETRLNCDFNDNIRGGNIDILLEQLDYVKIKKAEKDSYDWVTIFEKKIETADDLRFMIEDYIMPSNTTIKYAIVPILNGNIEGDYFINETDVKWSGVFIANNKHRFKLYSGVTYGTSVSNKEKGLLQPISGKYPIIIQNGDDSYISGTVQGTLLGYNYEDTRVIDRADVVKQANDFTEMLNSGDAFCITDWNGNVYIARCNGKPNISYVGNYGNGIVNISFTFVEQGKWNNKTDLYNNEFIDTID